MSLFPVILDLLIVDSGKERRLLAEPGLTPRHIKVKPTAVNAE